jgi:sulfur-oxidizing protein SoxY
MKPKTRNRIDGSRRDLLRVAVGSAALIAIRPASGLALPSELAAAVSAWVGGASLKEGRVRLDIADLIDNGNSVPITVQVDSPMTPTDHVTAIAVFNEKNPQRDVVRFGLGVRAGKAVVSTRIRLATSQKLVAVARMSDGSCWSHTVDVVVTLAACIED